jgi:hypothetical protein
VRENIGINEPKQVALTFLAGYIYGGGACSNRKGG